MYVKDGKLVVRGNVAGRDMTLIDFSVWYAGAMSVVTVVIVTAASTLSYWLPLFRGPEPMHGDLNIAVAQFRRIDGTGRLATSNEATDFDIGVWKLLNDEVDDLNGTIQPREARLHFDVRGPSATGQLSGTTPDERSLHAKQLVDSIKASLVVYGTLQFGDDKTILYPELYLSKTIVPGAEELAGHYDFGVPITTTVGLTTGVTAPSSLRAPLLLRIKALAQFIIGLSYFSQRNVDEASRWFTMAESNAYWNDEDGKELLYLFQGNTEGQLYALDGDAHSQRMHLDSAYRYYNKALDVRPGWPRAILGSTEVKFQRVQMESTGCDGSYREAISDPLRQVLSDYLRLRANQTVSLSPDQSIYPVVKTRTEFGLGRTYLCLSLAHVEEHLLEARDAFKDVINDFDNGRQNLIDITAEAHGDLALTYWILWAKPDVPLEEKSRYGLNVTTEYERAIKILKDRAPQRQAVFLRQLAVFHDQLQEYEQSDKAFMEAIKRDPSHACDALKAWKTIAQRRPASSTSPEIQVAGCE